MNNILTVRQRMILGILNSRPESIKGREIAGILGVTDRQYEAISRYLRTS